jgi:hypothetical protein
MSISPAARQCAALTCALLFTITVAGCGSAITPPQATSSQPTAAAFPLATTVTTASGVWAVVVMGGSAAEENNFWQLFTIPAGGSQWSLVTPPAVADNGGLVTAADSAGASQLRVAFRPSQSLTFSPLASTADDGHTWTTGLLDAPIAAVPDALAARRTTMLALLADGPFERSASSGASWSRLARPGAIAASAAGSHCRVTALTAVSLTSPGTPLAGAACSATGSAGIFAYTRGTWRATGPALTGSLASQPVRVLRLTGTAAGNTALLMAGTGSQARLYAAWTSDGSRWAISPPLPTHGARVRSSGTGPGSLAWVMLADGRAATISGRSASWRTLPAPPARTAVLGVLPGGAVDALAVAGSNLTLFQLTGTPGTWSKTQEIKVPIQYESSS